MLPRTFEVPIAGFYMKEPAYIPDTITAENVGNYVLVLYNADSAASTDLKDYYLGLGNYLGQGRPGMTGAVCLGISGEALGLGVGALANIGANGRASWSAADPSICEAIAQYVSNYVETSSLPIRYVVGLCGLPSGDGIRYSTESSVPYQITSAVATYRGKAIYDGQDPFNVAEYGGPLVAWLDCGSYEATKAFINKEIVTADASGLQGDGITISGNAAGVGGTQWVFDDQSDTNYGSYFTTFPGDLEADGVSSDDITYNPDRPPPYSVIETAVSPAAYGSWGTHSGVLTGEPTTAWPSNGQVTFTGNAGWWVGMSVESFNGMYGETMGDPSKVFAATAFGSGSNGIAEYANTPVCFVGSTAEPYLAGVEGAAYFDRWVKGWSTLEAAWAGRNDSAAGICHLLVVTDICLDP